jgi:hypothetical protein
METQMQLRHADLAGSSSKGCTARGWQPATAPPPKIEPKVVALLKMSVAAGLLARGTSSEYDVRSCALRGEQGMERTV